jgi:hypothetical protein
MSGQLEGGAYVAMGLAAKGNDSMLGCFGWWQAYLAIIGLATNYRTRKILDAI